MSIKRQINIAEILSDFFPKELAKLISNYDNYLEGKIVYSFECHIRTILCIAVLPDGRIVSGASDKTLKIWNLQTGNCDITFRGHDHMVLCVAVLSDGRIVSGADNSTLLLWS
jgi:WD40 repeat protein